MILYKQVSGLTLAFSLFTIGLSNIYAQEEILPHFFPEGVRRTNVPAKQWQEWLIYYNAARHALADHEASWPGFVLGKDTIVLERTYFNQNVKLIFDNYVCEGKLSRQSCDGKIRYHSFDGQYYVTERQFQVVVSMVDDYAIRAVEEVNYPFWNDVESLAVASAAQVAGVSEADFRKSLDREDPLNPGITFRELRHIPLKPEKKDFIPFREIHIGLTPDYPSVLGVAWLNVGVIYYTPVAMVRDYLMNTPSVPAHEFVHANKKLQRMPLIWGFDAETMASIPEMLVEGNYLDLPFHGYASMFREFALVFYGLRFEQAMDEVIKRDYWMTMGNVVIDEDKFNALVAKWNLVKREFKKAFREVVSKFYSDPVFWTALNDKTVDNNFVFRVMMAATYNPTLLGGEETTMKKLKAREYRIKQMIDKAWEESGKPSDEMEMDHQKDNQGGPRVSLLFLSHIKDKYGISDELVQKFLKFHKIPSIEVLFTWEPAKLRKAIEDFIAKERRLTRRMQ